MKTRDEEERCEWRSRLARIVFTLSNIAKEVMKERASVWIDHTADSGLVKKVRDIETTVKRLEGKGGKGPNSQNIELDW